MEDMYLQRIKSKNNSNSVRDKNSKVKAKIIKIHKEKNSDKRGI